MAIENLPRPWLLAALTGLKLVDLMPPEATGAPERHFERALPRPEPRRRRLHDGVAGRKPEPVEHLN
jgi:hypothetical protein